MHSNKMIINLQKKKKLHKNCIENTLYTYNIENLLQAISELLKLFYTSVNQDIA